MNDKSMDFKGVCVAGSIYIISSYILFWVACIFSGSICHTFTTLNIYIPYLCLTSCTLCILYKNNIYFVKNRLFLVSIPIKLQQDGCRTDNIALCQKYIFQKYWFINLAILILLRKATGLHGLNPDSGCVVLNDLSCVCVKCLTLAWGTVLHTSSCWTGHRQGSHPCWNNNTSSYRQVR